MRFALLLAPLLVLSSGCDWLSDSKPGGSDAAMDFPVPSSWQVSSIDGVPAPSSGDRVMGTVHFGSGGEVGGIASCNHYGGSFSVQSDRSISISSLSATEMYCGDDLHPFENALFEGLHSAQRWSVEEDGRLLLAGAGERMILLPMLTGNGGG